MPDALDLEDFRRFLAGIPEIDRALIPQPHVDGRIHRFQLDRRDAKRSGWYALHRTELGLCGVVGSWRTGDRWRYRSWSGRRHDRAAVARAEAEFAAFRRRTEREQQQLAASAAERAQRLLRRATRTRIFPGHQWAARKRLATPLWRGPGGTVLVPLYDDRGELRSVQIIRSDGERRFLRGSRTRGLRFVLGDLEHAATIVICEGVATGDAIHRSTSYPTVCAMSAGNLEAVARSLRRSHPRARLIVAADHDQLEDGRNPGLEAARRAASATRAAVVCPPEPKSDCWDVWDREGEAAVRALIDGASPPTPPAPSSPPPPPRSQPMPEPPSPQPDEPPYDPGLEDGAVAFRLDRFGNPRRDGDNVARFVRDALAERLFFDAFTRQFLLDGSPADVLHRVAAELYAAAPNVSWPEHLVAEGLDYARANQHVTLVDSLRAALDAVPRLTGDTDWFHAAVTEGLTLDDDYDQRLAAEILRTWFVGLVARILEPGHKVDVALVLQGPQGVGKSMLLRTLALEPHWFTDALSLHKLDDKDSLMELAGKHIIELPELAGLRKAEFNTVKKWLTQTSDDYRPPYGRNIVACPRRFVIAATTNEHEYLRDTENRRFLILRVRRIDIGWFAAHRSHLYAQARDAFAAGVEPILPADVVTTLREEHDRAQETDPWEPVVHRALEGRSEIGAHELLDTVGVPMERRTHGDVVRVGRIMGQITGWHVVKARDGARRVKIYRRIKT